MTLTADMMLSEKSLSLWAAHIDTHTPWFEDPRGKSLLRSLPHHQAAQFPDIAAMTTLNVEDGINDALGIDTGRGVEPYAGQDLARRDEFTSTVACFVVVRRGVGHHQMTGKILWNKRTLE